MDKNKYADFVSDNYEELVYGFAEQNIDKFTEYAINCYMNSEISKAEYESERRKENGLER